MVDLASGIEKTPKLEPLPQEESGVQADAETFKNLAESQDVFLEQESPVTPIEQSKVIEGVPVTTAAAPTVIPKDEVTIEVEKVLEDGLGDFFKTLPDTAKPKFKQKGEEAATELSGMVRSLKIQVKRALLLIRDWLLTIPGVNKFFLEQEAKIKVDQLLELTEARKEELTKKP